MSHKTKLSQTKQIIQIKTSSFVIYSIFNEKEIRSAMCKLLSKLRKNKNNTDSIRYIYQIEKKEMLSLRLR